MPSVEQKTADARGQIRETNMEIKPFRAFRFDPAVVGDAGRCVAPPFDVISPSQQEHLYEKSQYNVARITKGKTNPSDDGSSNQYTRAAKYFHRWLKEGALKQDPADAIYAYIQDFQLAGTSFQRLNFIALAKLEDFGPPGRVRPHEQILNEPMIDRLKLKKATGARFGLVFMLYEDQQKIADGIIENTIAQTPLMDFVNDEQIRHRIFAITSRHDIDAIAKMMSDKTCIIADGHHRYTTGLTYSKESCNPSAKYQMLAFSNTCQDGLKVLATHRLIGNLEGFSIKRLIGRLKDEFDMLEFPFDSSAAKEQARQSMFAKMKADFGDERNVFGIYGGGSSFWLAVLREKQAMDSVAPHMSPAWRALDAAVLHKLVLEKLLHIDDKKLAKGENVEYIRDTPDAVDDAIRRIDAGHKQAVFFMNPIRMQQLKMVTDAGERMPPKSTYFYPKMYTGLTIQKL
jgi:uncharacterized protein (DUF1015 family)